MNLFMDNDFLLESDSSRFLYHRHASKMPIIDYHCHLSPQLIAQNYQFKDITEIWLGGDHYKWRALRGNGVSEDYITGDKPSYSKFEKWAETVPYTMRNPLYHWTHLELFRIFGINKVLNPKTALEIFEECNVKLHSPEFYAQSLMKMSNVELVCTTDDPVDSLEYHRQISEKPFGVKIFPTWRPDKAMAIENQTAYNDYLNTLEKASDCSIDTYNDLLKALKKQHDFFALCGCKLSDHGLETFYAESYTATETESIFLKVRGRKDVSYNDVQKLKSAILFDLAVMDWEKSWTQQFHIGPIRNNNPRLFDLLGPDVGCDAIHDRQVAEAGHKFFGRLDNQGNLAKTILYNLNPKDNESMASLAYTFNDGTIAGKMQYGSAWWFLDNEYGIVNQINTLSSQGLLSRFVGMTTDSRSFLSYPRHEYFRRILCNLIGNDLEKGKLPLSEIDFIGQMVENIAYNNARNYLAL